MPTTRRQRQDSPSVTVARRILADAENVDFGDPRAMAGIVGSLREAVRMLLAEGDAK